MNNLFPPELRTASVVNRWSIVRTLKPDNVAEHSYYVTCYSVALARLLEWKGSLADLMYLALMHDVEELLTGDLVSPVKGNIVDDSLYERYVTEQMDQRLPGIQHQMIKIVESPYGYQAELIVKVADKVDAVLFLMTECGMGNTKLEPLLVDAMRNLRSAWGKLEEEIETMNGEQLWDDHLWPAIQAHYKYGGVGVT